MIQGILVSFRNISRRLQNQVQSNNRAELTAVIYALQYAYGQSESFTILTDSMYVIKGLRAWVKTWKANGWKTSNQGAVKNVDLWEELDRLYLALKHRAEVKHVKGHSKSYGNRMADQLAVDSLKF